MTQDNAPAGRSRAGGLSLLTAVCLVTGNIIGGGVFLLPATVAPYGTVSIVALAVLTVGAVALAMLFGRLAARAPVTGGLYVYPRKAFGDFAGFVSVWSYWTMTWSSNAALAVAAVGYVQVLAPVPGGAFGQAMVALAVLWLPALVNFAGLKYVATVQVVSTVLKFLPLVVVAVLGLFFVRAENFGPFVAPGEGVLPSLSASAAILLYSYLGVESAAVSAGEVRDPERNVIRAGVLGTLASAVVYLLGTVAVFGLVPHSALVNSEAPFSDAMNAIFGGSAGGTVIAVAAVLSIAGALNGWILMSAQMPYAAAVDGLFPPVFTRVRRNVPWVGVLIGVVLASLVILLNYSGGTGEVFRVLVLITSFTAAVPYLLSAAAQLYWLARGERGRVRTPRLVLDLIVAAVSFAVSLWLIAGAGYAAVYQGTLFLFAGLLVYVWLAARKARQANSESED
ncbi:amino acid permease [Amycolatopsis sp. NPDC059657]|uniref:amino acid permease n=1 Tax=Amycolatopsis sp. NPDC059657 TaxID=3346899 RepID=UPI00366FB618